MTTNHTPATPATWLAHPLVRERIVAALVEFLKAADTAAPPTPRSGRMADTVPTTQPAASLSSEPGDTRPHQRRPQSTTPALAG